MGPVPSRFDGDRKPGRLGVQQSRELLAKVARIKWLAPQEKKRFGSVASPQRPGAHTALLSHGH